MSEEALSLLWALRLEDGASWGEKACEQQKEDAEAILVHGPPYQHFITRPRGGSKSTDIAGLLLGWLLVDAAPGANAHVVAANAEQATIIIDAVAAFIMRTPELSSQVIVEAERVIGPNGAWVQVLPQSGSGAWGLRDAHFLICDEFCQWDETRGAKRVWTAIRSTVQKVKGCRLVLLSSAPEPSHWTYSILERAKKDRAWRVSEMPGPVPWHDAETLAALKRDLSEAEYSRLVLNIPAEESDRAVTEEEYQRAIIDSFPYGGPPVGLTGYGWRTRHPQLNTSYIITLDFGLKNDATVFVVAHRESENLENFLAPSYVVIDHIERWVGSQRHHVQVGDVRSRLAILSKEYNNAPVYSDPYQMIGGLQELRLMGIKALEWPFTTTSVGYLAGSLSQAFHNGQIFIPDYDDLHHELLSVKLRETTPGVVRLYHERNEHDDQAVAIGMAVHILIGDRKTGQGSIWMEAWKRMLEKTQPVTVSKPNMNQLTEETFTPASLGCRQHRFFGPERQCVFCGSFDQREGAHGLA